MAHRRGTSPEIRDLLREAEKAGCIVEKCKRGGHYKVVTPNGPVFVSFTPSSRYAATMARSDLRRKGVAI